MSDGRFSGPDEVPQIAVVRHRQRMGS